MRARDLTESEFLAACRERGWTEGFGGYWVTGWTGRRKLIVHRRSDVTKRRDEQLAYMDRDAASLVRDCSPSEQRVLRKRSVAAMVQRVSGGARV